MDGITSALSSLGNSGAFKDATTLANLGSTAYGLYNQWQQQQYQNKLRDLATNPAAVSKLAAGYTTPLNAGLTTGVANQAQAYLASRGLSDSPQISEQVEAQAIAPYIQQNQQAGYSNALQALGLGGGAINPALQQKTGINSLANIFSQFGGGQNALANLLRLANSGPAPQITPTDTGIDWSIPYEPTQDIDLSAWQPDYSAELAAGS